MLRAGEDSQALELPLSDGVLLKHTADCKTHCEFGLLGHKGLILGLLQAAGITGVGTVVLLLQLLAGEDGVLGVDDDDVVTAVNVGGVIGFQLAAQQVGGESSGLAQGLAGCVKDVPFAGNGLLGYHGRRHILCLHIELNVLTIQAQEFTINAKRTLFLYHSFSSLSTPILILISKSPEIF